MAAALAYGINGGTDGDMVLVFDVGGGTYDVRCGPWAFGLWHECQPTNLLLGLAWILKSCACSCVLDLILLHLKLLSFLRIPPLSLKQHLAGV